MPWFKRVKNNLIGTSGGSRGFAAIQLGVDASGKAIVVGVSSSLDDTLFTNGSGSQYGTGSLCLDKLAMVDADHLWQAVTMTTVSQSVSPSSSVSPSGSSSASKSPSASGSPSKSPSSSKSPSASASPS
jgi:hypothetical protein